MYINPKDGSTKEAWIEKNALRADINAITLESVTADGKVAIALVDNGPFTAAAVMHNQIEWNELTRQDDPRVRKYFVADRSKVAEECPELAN